MRLLLLGPPVLEHAKGRLPFACERRFQLLALLAHQTDWVSRERLAALLWPRATLERARANLRKVLFGLRGWDPLFGLVIEEQHGALRWSVPTDLQAFEAALAAGDLAAAVGLWRGDPWAGLDGVETSGLDEWLNYERQRLRASWRDALLRLGEREADPVQRSAWVEQLLAHDPLDEEAVQLKMQACAQAGRAGAVARVYHPFAKALAEAVGIEPSARTQALLNSALQPAPLADRAAAEPSRSAVAAAAGDADFTGRLVEQRELAELLGRPDVRWVTLLGPGGIGKTRFLNHVLPSLASSFAEGAVYVPLDDLDGADNAVPRLAQRLGVRLDAEESPVAQLQRALQARQLLLALDNLEHVRALAQLVSELLPACPGLRVVVTSRERAEVPGEWPMVMDGLPYPEADDIDRADAFDAVRLFTRRARAMNPRFDLNRERGDVVALCALVEGMPLALELAAVWTRHFSVAEIVRDLTAGGALLAEPQAGRAKRQQSMALAFEHSWGLLSDAERDVLKRLSVFAGGFTRDAARWVAGATVGVLMALIDKSLLRKEEVGGTSRFHFHPLLQQLQKRRLDDDPSARDAALLGHADFYCRLLARYQGGTPPRAWAAEADADAENILHAWNHAVRSSMTALLANAVMGFVSQSYRIGQWEAGLAALDAAVRLPDLPAHERARMRTYSAVLQLNLGRDKEAAQGTQEALAVLRKADDRRPVQSCLFYQGMARLHLGDFAAAESCLRESLELAEAAGNAVGFQSCLSGLVDLLHLAGRYDEAIEMAQRAEMDDEFWIGHVADDHRLAGRPQRALQLLQAQLAEPPPSLHDSYLWECRWMVMQTAAAAHLDLGDLTAAERLADMALEAQRELGRGSVPVVTLPTCLLRSRLAWLRGDAGAAHRLLAEASAVASRQRSHQHLVRVAVHWARLLAALGEREHAGKIVRMALAEPTTGAETRCIALELAHAPGLAGGDDIAAAPGPAAVSTLEIMMLVRIANALCAEALKQPRPVHSAGRLAG